MPVAMTMPMENAIASALRGSSTPWAYRERLRTHRPSAATHSGGFIAPATILASRWSIERYPFLRRGRRLGGCRKS